MTIVCSRNTVWQSPHISFFCGGDPFYEVVQRPENTREELTGLLGWPVVLSTSLERLADLCLQYKITDPILSFKSHEHACSPAYFSVYGWLSELTCFFYFPVICWSYLRTEISITLSIGNKLYSRRHLIFFSFLWDHLVDVILWPPWIWRREETCCHSNFSERLSAKADVKNSQGVIKAI